MRRNLSFRLSLFIIGKSDNCRLAIVIPLIIREVDMMFLSLSIREINLSESFSYFEAKVFLEMVILSPGKKNNSIYFSLLHVKASSFQD